ncbi:uncharacterized protein LOC106062450 isoform X1 [Biomphalaria glabrata]|uniref:Uncharacterized protein LOC106062450 isoform X1 n=2 Tax=Biomphalaria glabrata TaxID=6526 RepID=A0A9W2YSY8_BIOGL|nr:uncharacterized protein LOC106062450 isoform X1 [Biomphalaria glabrata]
MILISEDLIDNVDVDLKKNFNRKEDFTGNIEDLKPYKTKDVTMAIKKESTEDSGVISSRSSGQLETGLMEKLITLSLDEKPHNSVELIDKLNMLSLEEKPHKKSEPQEDDECSEESLRLTIKAEVKDEPEDSRQCDRLVKLAAPSFEDNEESGENEPDDPDKLKDRGPSHGVATCYSQDNQSHMIHDYQMPDNFPDYSNNSYAGHVLPSNKRQMDKYDCSEPYKYRHPNQNDLSNPTSAVTSVVSNVKQMSGGTVVTSPEINNQDFFSSSSDLVNLDFCNEFDDYGDYQVEQTLGLNISEKPFDDGVSDGYLSDFNSPAHSPQDYNNSPIAPMSHESGDSGVFSPMGEDTQVRSPRQTNVDSYQSRASPYQVQMSPQQHPRMSPPNQSILSTPHHQFYQIPQQAYQPHPAVNVTGNVMYQHQMNVNVCNASLKSPLTCQATFVDECQEDFTHPYVTSNLDHLQNALSVISNDLYEELKIKKAQLPSHNIPRILDENERQPMLTAEPKPALEKSAQYKKSTPPAQSLPSPPNPMLPPTVTTLPQTAKIPIPPLSSSKKVSPIIIKSQGYPVSNSYPVFVISSNPLPQSRFKEIRPKTISSTKPANVCAENTDSNSSNSNMSPPPAPTTTATVPQQTQNSNNNKVSLITIARRIVAGMDRNELIKKDVDGDTVLHVSVCRPNCLYLVQALLERLNREGLDDMINAQNYMGQTPLYLAVSSNHHKVVQLLIEKNADVNPFAECKLPSGLIEKSAAIHCASSRGEVYLETLKELLKAPDNHVHLYNSDGHTPLTCAILCHGKVEADGSRLNSIPIIQTLIEAGADPNLQTQKSGKTSLMYALESKDIDLIEKIFQLVDPVKLSSYLKSNAFDGSTCQKIADSLKPHLSKRDQIRLTECMKPKIQRNV